LLIVNGDGIHLWGAVTLALCTQETILEFCPIAVTNALDDQFPIGIDEVRVIDISQSIAERVSMLELGSHQPPSLGIDITPKFAYPHRRVAVREFVDLVVLEGDSRFSI